MKYEIRKRFLPNVGFIHEIYSKSGFFSPWKYKGFRINLEIAIGFVEELKLHRSPYEVVYESNSFHVPKTPS